MSVKKQSFSPCKLFLSYEERPEAFSDETDVDTYFHLFDLSQSQHRIVRVSEVSSKKTFAIKLFPFCDSKTQKRFFVQAEVTFSKRELSPLVEKLLFFPKTIDNARKF